MKGGGEQLKKKRSKKKKTPREKRTYLYCNGTKANIFSASQGWWGWSTTNQVDLVWIGSFNFQRDQDDPGFRLDQNLILYIAEVFRVLKTYSGF